MTIKSNHLPLESLSLTLEKLSLLDIHNPILFDFGKAWVKMTLSVLAVGSKLDDSSKAS